MGFYIIAEKEIGFSWDILRTKVITQEFGEFDFFPIVDVDYNALGVSISKAKISSLSFRLIKKLVYELIEMNFKVFELYTGSEITKKNVKDLKRYFP